jgi:hypothetical protein
MRHRCDAGVLFGLVIDQGEDGVLWREQRIGAGIADGGDIGHGGIPSDGGLEQGSEYCPDRNRKGG